MGIETDPEVGQDKLGRLMSGVLAFSGVGTG